MISNGLNGGGITELIDGLVAVNLIISIKDSYEAILILQTAIKLVLSATSLMPVVGGVVLFAFSMYSIYLTVNAYLDTLANYEAACMGDADAISAIVSDTILNVGVEIITCGVSKGSSELAKKYLKSVISNTFTDTQAKVIKDIYGDNLFGVVRYVKKASNLGLSTDTIFKLISNSKSLGYSKSVLKALANLDAALQGNAAEALAKNSDVLPLILKNSDAISESLYLLAKHGDEALPVIKNGDSLVKSVFGLDDSAAEIFIEEASKQNDSFYEYLKSLDESYLNEIIASSKADIDKISKWDYQPSYELYVRNKSVYDNPKYFDQTMGATLYPAQDGFLDGVIPEPTVVPKGTYFKRYGNSSGAFLGEATDSLESRSLPPFTDQNDFHYYRLNCDYAFTTGKIEPWFGQPGNGNQYVVYEYDVNGNIVLNGDGSYSRISVKTLINDGVLEDITDKVLKGEIIIE